MTAQLLSRQAIRKFIRSLLRQDPMPPASPQQARPVGVGYTQLVIQVVDYDTSRPVNQCAVSVWGTGSDFAFHVTGNTNASGVTLPMAGFVMGDTYHIYLSPPIGYQRYDFFETVPNPAPNPDMDTAYLLRNSTTYHYYFWHTVDGVQQGKAGVTISFQDSFGDQVMCGPSGADGFVDAGLCQGLSYTLRFGGTYNGPADSWTPVMQANDATITVTKQAE